MVRFITISSKTGYPVETQLEAVSLVAKKGRQMDIDCHEYTCLDERCRWRKGVYQEAEKVLRLSLAHRQGS